MAEEFRERLVYEADINDVRRKLDELQRRTSTVAQTHEGSARRSSRAWEGVTQTLGKVGRIGAVAVTAAAVAAVGLIGVGVKVAADMEQASIGFESMLGSAEAADEMLRKLSDFAAKTPFELPDVVQGTRRLLAMGYAADAVIPLMGSIGNAVAAMGGGAEMIDRVTTALGQMQAKGKVSAEEMLQLAESGIPAWEFLANKLGVDIPEAMDRVTKGAVKSETFVAAFMEGTANKFGNAMEKQSKSLLGMVSTLKDNIMIRLADAASPLVVSFKEAIPEIDATITGLIDDIGPSFGELVAEIARFIRSLLPIAAPVLTALTGAFSQILQALVPVLTMLAPHAAEFAGAIAELVIAFVPLIPQLGAMLDAILPLVPPLVHLATAVVQLAVSSGLLGPILTAVFLSKMLASARNVKFFSDALWYGRGLIVAWRSGLMTLPALLGSTTAALAAVTIGVMAFSKAKQQDSENESLMAEAIRSQVIPAMVAGGTAVESFGSKVSVLDTEYIGGLFGSGNRKMIAEFWDRYHQGTADAVDVTDAYLEVAGMTREEFNKLYDAAMAEANAKRQEALATEVAAAAATKFTGVIKASGEEVKLWAGMTLKDFEKWRDGTVESFNGVISVLDELAGKSKLTASDIIKAFDEQLRAMRGYETNWDKLLQRGLPESLAVQLQSMGLKGAGIVKALATANDAEFKKIITQWLKAEGKAGNIAGAINDIAGELLGIPKNTSITVTFGAKTTSTFNEVVNKLENLDNIKGGFASGGYVPFTGLALVHAGEFVFNPDAVTELGRSTLEALNKNQTTLQPLGGDGPSLSSLAAPAAPISATAPRSDGRLELALSRLTEAVQRLGSTGDTFDIDIHTTEPAPEALPRVLRREQWLRGRS